MNKSLKIGLLVTGTLAVGAITYFSIKVIKRKKEEEEMARIEAEINKELLNNTNEGLNSTAPSTNNSSCVEPKRNFNQDINNGFEKVKGLTLYPAQKSSDPEKGHSGGIGYANIRTSPEANNKTGWFDYSNMIGKISGGNPIGKIVSEKYDNQEPAHRWFGVRLAKTMELCVGSSFFGNCMDVKFGWVRADVVTFKKKC